MPLPDAAPAARVDSPSSSLQAGVIGGELGDRCPVELCPAAGDKLLKSVVDQARQRHCVRGACRREGEANVLSPSVTANAAPGCTLRKPDTVSKVPGAVPLLVQPAVW